MLAKRDFQDIKHYIKHGLQGCARCQRGMRTYWLTFRRRKRHA